MQLEVDSKWKGDDMEQISCFILSSSLPQLENPHPQGYMHARDTTDIHTIHSGFYQAPSPISDSRIFLWKLLAFKKKRKCRQWGKTAKSPRIWGCAYKRRQVPQVNAIGWNEDPKATFPKIQSCWRSSTSVNKIFRKYRKLMIFSLNKVIFLKMCFLHCMHSPTDFLCMCIQF